MPVIFDDSVSCSHSLMPVVILSCTGGDKVNASVAATESPKATMNRCTGETFPNNSTTRPSPNTTYPLRPVVINTMFDTNKSPSTRPNQRIRQDSVALTSIQKQTNAATANPIPWVT